VKAVDAIWNDVVSKKLYITGGIGARGGGEAFGGPYELPNMTAYNETCAAVGNDFWNHRLFLLHADAKYIDVMERTLYNGLISGVSLDGKAFFYPNPLESIGQHERSPWFGVACCPGNITRFLASVPGYVYAQQGDTLYVNLFAAGTADIPLGGRRINIVQQTRYPWDGAVKMIVKPQRAGEFTIKLRIPGWARNEPVPSDLYRFLDAANESPSVKINGTPVAMAIDKGYATLSRRWQSGDGIDLNLPMPSRRIAANDRVDADRDRVALQRGPIVYAAEWPDNANGHVRNLVLPDNATPASQFRADLLGGVQTVTAKGYGLAKDAEGRVVKTEQTLVAIPYSTWANRGRGEMLVWIPRTEAAARPTPFPTIATRSKVTTSGRKNPRGINDGEEPSASNDSSSYFDWWPTKGTTEWIEYAFAAPATVSASEVYWFDDTGRGEVRVPQSWRLLYKDGAEWKPVDVRGTYGVEKDRFNVVSFAPVTTTGLRLEVTMQPQWSAGVQEWKVR
jgi:DUF1680 family protein